ncbi:hypothetical protein TNCV_1631711 [Trichonephila clavipes]|nr:hypothetical protein TNCV_1631711 [Trichonephila clavipes]
MAARTGGCAFAASNENFAPSSSADCFWLVKEELRREQWCKSCDACAQPRKGLKRYRKPREAAHSPCHTMLETPLLNKDIRLSDIPGDPS